MKEVQELKVVTSVNQHIDWSQNESAEEAVIRVNKFLKEGWRLFSVVHEIREDRDIDDCIYFYLVREIGPSRPPLAFSRQLCLKIHHKQHCIDCDPNWFTCQVCKRINVTIDGVKILYEKDDKSLELEKELPEARPMTEQEVKDYITLLGEPPKDGTEITREKEAK